MIGKLDTESYTRMPSLGILHSLLALISITMALEVLATECRSKSAFDSLLIPWNRCTLGLA